MLGAARATFVGASAPVGGLSYRSDSYSSYVYLAVPFDEETGMDDVSHIINTSSTQATLSDGPASSLDTNNQKWTTPDYVNSYLGATGLGAANTYALSTSFPAANSGTYVVEVWARATSTQTNANWCLSSADSGGRWLLGINSGSTSSSALAGWIGLGDSNWHHVAMVCDGGTKRLYKDGLYIHAWTSSNTGFSTLHVGQFNSGDANDYRGNLQDLRVSIGTNRGYTGTNTGTANFTLPSSIVESY